MLAKPPNSEESESCSALSQNLTHSCYKTDVEMITAIMQRSEIMQVLSTAVVTQIHKRV